MFSTEDSRHHQQLPPPIPPSPTLSNPDMILPFDENERENATPSPPFNLPSLSHLQYFYGSRTDYANEPTSDPTRSGMSGGAPRPQKKPFPRRAWMHEGHDAASRRLSDIGEEDTTSPSRPGRMTPTYGARTPSSSSSSTLSGASETSSGDRTKGNQDGYAVSQDNPQLTESPAMELPANGGQSSSPNAVTTKEEGGPGEDLSSAILSSEAERILENAKKRLTLMEGNLTRARTSVRASPSPSLSPSLSVGSPSAGLGQPVGGLYQSISRTDRRSSNLRPRQMYPSQEKTSNRHSRVYSETNLPSNLSNNIEPSLSRSLSAMGSSSTWSFRSDERSFPYAPTRAYLTHRPSASSMQQPPISNSIPPAISERSSSSSPQGLGISEEDNERTASMEDFNAACPTNDPPSRSQSQLQVRDLQDQMKGLHIKISSLKVKAQEDNLRRRSLQSLRTPSPLTAATHWYANPLDPTTRHSNLHPSSGYRPSPESPRGSQDSSGRTSSNHTETTLILDPPQDGGSSTTDSNILRPFELADHDDHSVVVSLYEDAEEGEYDSESSPPSDIDREALEEILREPLDEDLDGALEAFPAVPRPDATPHEEREDAFDYEHFILHSALGNYSQARLRRPSNASDTSVETTRPIQDRHPVRHSRSDSTASLSTVASFATAAEGNDDIESVLYWDRKFNKEMRSNYREPDVEDRALAPDSDPGTPRASRHTHGGRLAVSQRPDSAATGSATPTSLASSLVSTVRAAASPHPNSVKNGQLGINEDDTRLLEQLFKSLGDVCTNLQSITTSPEPDMKQARVLRRRLEGARRVLDGELDA
ncbi:hypothetical protein AOCH_006913 [Aspergillus ochraceoroseus]|uniref:Uncharacterized protein n=1 Tax=Aspergillus ochraceoroseus TaxID=138278 RepID=A0A0F8WTB1_9EURO|nr:hypothetical protein AOCH_006913 [Aspergillus ochraceoroseus]